MNNVMKIKITRPDGTIIEVEGTAQDIQTIAYALGLAPTLPIFSSPVAGGGLLPLWPQGQTFKVG